MSDRRNKKKSKVSDGDAPYLDRPEVRAQLDAITREFEADGWTPPPYLAEVVSITEYRQQKAARLGGRGDV